MLDGGGDDLGDLGLGGRIHHGIGGAGEDVAADPDEVADALAVRVDDTLEVAGHDVAFAHDEREGGGDVGGDARRGDVELVERGGRGDLVRPEVDADHLLDEGRERGLVFVVEGDAVDAPPPPFHVLDVGTVSGACRRLRLEIGHGRAPSDGADDPRISAEY
ncbi:hypothetical protein GCM10025867_02500 [Frondihabitans sucicola]|uniref:Uncharacterized protein n=1 Tax=Frondihabitans sucicola TaxID=1268041 RepID=A0ABN6XSZ6_9MICO|nr:hypothetical protein GCM10025867_02500 [Frondihabitans sucicola]